MTQLVHYNSHIFETKIALTFSMQRFLRVTVATKFR